MMRMHADLGVRDAALRSLRSPGEGTVPTDSIVRVESLIVILRRQRVILAADLAGVYGVATRALGQAVKRNAARFPDDFVFRLTPDEAREIQASRSQSVILKRGQNVKYLPLAFTEHGALMAASVLNSLRAVQMSIFVVRAFLRLREWAGHHAEFATKLAELERRVAGHDDDLKAIVRAIRQLTEPPATPRRKIGFRAGESR